MATLSNRGANDSAQMRTVVYDRYGPPEVLRQAVVDRPVPGNDDVLIRVRAASTGVGETAIRGGKLALVTGRKFPRGTGVDFAGEVVETGCNVMSCKSGDQVWGVMPYMTFGSISEYVSVPSTRVALAPRNLDLVHAASLPASGTTVIRALRIEAAVRPGERLLIRGASGGVGSVAVQLGKAMGAHVTGMASARNLDWVKQLGADDVMDYARAAQTDLGQFDVVLDLVGSNMGAYRRLLTPGGRMIAITVDTENVLGSLLYVVATRVFGSRPIRLFNNNPDQSVIAELTSRVEAGAIRPFVAKVWSLDEVIDFHRALEAGGIRGKQVVRII